MHSLLSSHILAAAIQIIALSLKTACLSQETTDPAYLPEDSFIWDKEEIEPGFLQCDDVRVQAGKER